MYLHLKSGGKTAALQNEPVGVAPRVNPAKMCFQPWRSKNAHSIGIVVFAAVIVSLARDSPETREITTRRKLLLRRLAGRSSAY